MKILDFDSNIVLENERVILLPLGQEFFSDLLPFSLNEHTLWKYSLVSANGAENLQRYFDKAIEARVKKDSYTWVVYDKLSAKFAGSTRYYDYQKDHATVQLGYTWYGSEFWGTGLNQNCKYLLLKYAFEDLNLERVEFRADANNARSIAAMKSLGCTIEGLFRKSLQREDGSRRDSVLLSILKEEWIESVQEKLRERI
ncbi:GNAT family N-acetyltransferase [Saprospiraceae bacterium]|nr:GNAT family N-acetyltransferase [Saprospiraceae bacterium]